MCHRSVINGKKKKICENNGCNHSDAISLASGKYLDIHKFEYV